jgi:hypothetical protein
MSCCVCLRFSGKTDRHRLNRGGDRHANSALWRIVIVRMTSHQPTKNYIARRTAEGLSKQEIIRCLKRYVARELFPHVQKVITPTALEPPTNTQRRPARPWSRRWW